MKRIIIAMLIMACAAGVFAGQGDMQLGPNLGFIIPTGDAADVWAVSPKLGAKFIYGMNDKIDLEGYISYGILQFESDYADLFDDLTTSMIEIAASGRYNLTDSDFYLGAGLSYNIFKLEWDDPYWGENDSNSSEIGLNLYAGYEKKFNSFTLDPQLKFQLIDGDLWGALEIGFNFPIGK